MRIAIGWNWPSRLADCSFRFERYAAGVRALGHEPLLACARPALDGFPTDIEAVPCADLAEMARDGYWRRVGADLVVLVTWHGMLEELAAIRRAGARVAAFSDTDGRLGGRVHARASFARSWATAPALRARLGVLRHRASGWLPGRARARFAEDERAVESTRRSHAVLFGHAAGVAEFTRLLVAAGAGELATRLHVVPFAIAAPFTDGALPAARAERVVTVGRWDAPQKDVALLARVIERAGRTRPGTRFELFGAGGERVLGALARRLPGVELRGPQPFEAVAAAMAGARVVLFSSRWEGCPHAALEGLASGCTLVGPPLPALVSWSEDGRCGTLAPRRAAPLAAALVAELARWERGERDPEAIAAAWRRRLAPSAIVRGILDAAGL